MKKVIELLVGMVCYALLALSGCATTSNLVADTTATNTRIIAAAQKVNRVATDLVNIGGPFAVTAYCIAQPAACAEAKTALTTAKATNAEITRILAALSEANAAEQGTKLITLYQSFRTELASINALVKTCGGTPIDLSEFDGAVAEFQANTIAVATDGTTASMTK